MNDLEKVQFKRWKRAASIQYQKNAKIKSKRIAFVRTLHMAQEYTKTPLHFVYQNDFRGRKYAVSSFVSPQGPDYSKGLLVFGQTKPILDESGYTWLCVHGANTYGNDKLRFQDRKAWVESKTEDILAVAKDPLDCKWWADASDPLQFLAFCFEFAGFKQHGYGFLSRLPIALDGRNNGLQHLSALGLDEVGGRATCLIDSETPEDMYQLIYELLWSKVEEDAHNPLAQMWLAFGGSRSLCKRPIMVIPYGGTKYSCRDYIQDYIQDEIEAGAVDEFKDDIYRAVAYLADLMWTTANEAVPAARKIMAYLQAVGRALAKENLPVIWQSPSGFWVHQMYPETSSRRITTHIDGSLIKPQVRLDNFKAVDRRRASNGVSPNFVHSMDAAAMTITINKALDAGIDSFAMIHDSYGVHSQDTDLMGKLIRESFVQIYRDDWLAKFVSHAEEVLPDLPSPPEKGDLDIEEVIDSQYFFA
jgi:DNA-directed RNA polymerase